MSIKLSIETRKVLIMFQRKVMMDGRQFKRTVSFLNIGGHMIKNKRYKLNFGFIKLTRKIMNIIWLRGRSLVNIGYKKNEVYLQFSMEDIQG
jgi:hypothetical protein